MGSPLKIREDRSPGELRRLARREAEGRVAARLYAIANALDGTNRAEAARLAGMERQALRDAVLRYNTGGGGSGTGGGDPAWSRARPRRLLCLDARRSVPLDGRSFRQKLSPVEHDP